MADAMSVEQKIDLLADKIDGLSTRIDGLSTTFDGLETRIDALTEEVAGLKTDVGELKSRVGSVEGRLDDLSMKMSVGFEESHRLVKLSLEGLGALKETTDARFDTMSAEHSKQFDLLTKFGVHVRRRVERLEAPPPRRRR
ncbi:MAG: hypothetical protein ACRD2N_17295 [Vicinamibacterales bacterium]